MIQYQKELKDSDTILTEVQTIAPVVDAVKFTGSALIFFCSKELTAQEIDALANYNPDTLRETK